jgi:hypothetical protein
LAEPRKGRTFLALRGAWGIPDSAGVEKDDRVRITLEGNATTFEPATSPRQASGWPRWVIEVDRWFGLRILGREGEPMGRTFMDRPITKEIVSLGIGGEIAREDGFPELPPRARVSFTAVAEYANVKHTFLAKGGIKEALILTIDADSFQVTGVEEPPEQLDMLDGAEPEAGEE